MREHNHGVSGEGGSPSRTTACSRLPPASAPLPLPAAAEAQRSVARAAGGRRGIVPTSAGRAGGLSGAALVPVVGGRRYAAGRPGSGARSPTPGRLPLPNNALERTGHNGHHVADVGWFGVARRSPRALGRLQLGTMEGTPP